MSTRVQISVIWLTIGVHVGIDLLLLVLPLDVNNGMAFLLGWPLGQGSLLVLWGCQSRLPLYWRVPAVVCGLAAVWLITMKLLSNIEIRDPGGAAWAMMYVVQGTLVAGVITLERAIRWMIRRRGNASTGAPPRYSIAYLLLGTTAICALLAVGRIAIPLLGWTAEVFRWTYFFFLPVVGTYNAMLALLVWALLARRRWWAVRAVAGVACGFLLGATGPLVLTIAFGESGGVTTGQFAVLTGTQGICLVATLLPLGLVKCNGPAEESLP